MCERERCIDSLVKLLLSFLCAVFSFLLIYKGLEQDACTCHSPQSTLPKCVNLHRDVDRKSDSRMFFETQYTSRTLCKYEYCPKQAQLGFPECLQKSSGEKGFLCTPRMYTPGTQRSQERDTYWTSFPAVHPGGHMIPLNKLAHPCCLLSQY